MLVPAAGEARDDERHLGQLAEVEVIKVLAFAAAGALVVGPSLPEDKHVISVAERDAVLADIVDPPTDACCFEQIEDYRIVKDTVPPDAIGRDPAGGAGGEVKPVGPGGPHDRAEIVGAQGRGFEEAVVEGEV